MKTLFVCLAIALLPIVGVGAATSLLLSPQAQKSTQLPRDVYVNGTIDDNMAADINYQLELLNKENSDDITMHITSGGGGVYPGLRIYDNMMESESKINTVCEGYCMSMAAVLLVAGSHREASENTAIMLHEVSFGASGKLTEVENEVKEAKRLQAEMNTIIMRHSGLTLDQVKKMEAYDHFMSSQEAKELGLVDSVREYKKK